MDEDAPPRKMSKPDTFFKQNHDAVLEKCRETLAKYGISGNFETSTNLDTVPNEVIVALVCAKLTYKHIYKIVLAFLGLEEDEGDYDQFRRSAKRIKEDATKIRKTKDEYPVFFAKNCV
uniref:Uncharacterized protein n=1 Tax=Caenorhabditis japonica TaxID=281687 RepID=A0A8R1ICM9_CAEJA